jgi:hypothetical protein
MIAAYLEAFRFAHCATTIELFAQAEEEKGVVVYNILK